MKLFKFITFVFITVFLQACAGTLQPEDIIYCQNELCSKVKNRKEIESLFDNLYLWFKTNDGQRVSLCAADADTKKCIEDGIGTFVLALIPGMATVRHSINDNVRYDREKLEIRFDSNHDATYYGANVLCSETEVVIKTKSDTEMLPSDTTHYCNWMGVGNLVISKTLVFDYFNFDDGNIGGPYSWTFVAVGGVGSSDGYMLFKGKAAGDEVDDLLDPYKRKSQVRDEDEPLDSQSSGGRKSSFRD